MIWPLFPVKDHLDPHHPLSTMKKKTGKLNDQGRIPPRNQMTMLGATSVSQCGRAIVHKEHKVPNIKSTRAYEKVAD